MKIPKESQGLIKLIMMGGIITFIAGILFGGYFGMTPEQAPDFLTFAKTLESGEVIKAFKWQIINPSQGSGPLTFLILAAVLGVIQVMFGIMVDGFAEVNYVFAQERFSPADRDPVRRFADFLEYFFIFGN